MQRKPKSLKSEREERFKEIHPPYTAREAMQEANRCLYCYDAPCIVACPTHIDIPTFIRKISTDNLKGSARTILESNLLGATCSRVCPVEELCEGACVLNHDHKPITIGRLQRHAMDFASQNRIKFFERGEPNGFRVAIIGTGPAGLSCAGELAQLGFEVTCFERKPLGGGLDTYGIVVFREPVEVSLAEVTMIEELGVDIRNNVEVGKEISLEELIDTYDALFVAVGLSNVPQLGIKGEALEGVHDGIEFIEKTKTTDINKIESGTNVVIVGAGNTAIDCATIAKRLGAENVTIVYRRSQREMPAYQFEYEFATLEGINFRFLTQPVEILGKSKVEAIKCQAIKLGEPDQSGRRAPEMIADSEIEIACDTFIKAIGQNKHAELSKDLSKFGVQFVNGYIAIDPKTTRTANEKIFAGGDCVRHKGAATTVMAVEDGKLAAQAIFLSLIKQAKTG